MSKIYIFHFPNSLIHGVGEIDVKDKEKQDKSPEVQTPATFAPDIEAMPYLLLDIRDKDAFDKCHIIGGNIEALKGENCNQLMNQEATFMVSFIILCNPLFCCCHHHCCPCYYHHHIPSGIVSTTVGSLFLSPSIII